MSSIERLKTVIDERHFPLWGIVGSLVGLVFILGAQIPYSGRYGEPFSMLNHFVSELGEIGVSEFAFLFNSGMILAGLVFMPFMIGLGLYMDNIVSKIAGVVGVFSAVSIFLVGIFPMNYLAEHSMAAMSFFFSGMIMVGLWTLAILLQNQVKIPKGFSLGGVVNFVIFFLFLYGPWESVEDLSTRPDLWMVPTLEWGIYFAIVGFLLALSVFVWNKESRVSGIRNA
ncbi:MAG: DUF998 domain-containing protein [Promethearchaeota archaeon]